MGRARTHSFYDVEPLEDVRVEWRWERISFSLSNFWGYDDFGRGTEGCRGVSPLESSNPAHVADVHSNHHANQQLFTTICAATVAQSSLLPAGCGCNIWNSIEVADSSNAATPRLSMVFSAMLARQGRENDPNPGPFVALSTPDDADDDGISDVDPYLPGGRCDEFDPRNPYGPTTCSFADPILCKYVVSLLAPTPIRH